LKRSALLAVGLATHLNKVNMFSTFFSFPENSYRFFCICVFIFYRFMLQAVNVKKWIKIGPFPPLLVQYALVVQKVVSFHGIGRG
jgi:hypothetical protein